MGQFSGESLQPEPFDSSFVNVMRGKSLMFNDQEIGRDVRKLCRMIDWFEEHLDEYGEGDYDWRSAFGAVEND